MTSHTLLLGKPNEHFLQSPIPPSDLCVLASWVQQGSPSSTQGQHVNINAYPILQTGKEKTNWPSVFSLISALVGTCGL